MAEDDAARRAAELEALEAIYEGGVEAVSDHEWRLQLTDVDALLEVLLPVDYPSISAPAPVLRCRDVPADAVERLCEELQSLWRPNEEVVFAWAEHLREHLPSLSTAHAIAAEDAARPLPQEEGYTFTPATTRYKQRTRHFGAEAVDDSNAVTIVRGEVSEFKKSTFQAAVAVVNSQAQVNWALRELLQDKKVARATHNCIAYRFHDGAKGCVVSDCDDDGEHGAGAKLAALLELTGAENVLLVVSRWFGGILLGPDRFKCFAKAGSELLEAEGLASRGKGKRK